GRWEKIRAIRAEVLKAMEALRVAGKIGSSLQAAVRITAEDKQYDALAALGDDLKFAFIASTVTLKKGKFAIEVVPANGTKCERCWHVREEVGTDAEHPDLCGRCISNLYGEGEVRCHA
ncbi:MAG: isoleucine--tRNA ligase, partial [Zoogloeaceae bacterium]|nr:isoleucine--tRNA ligase [Zoogloeaceae bacterium]